MVHLLLYAVALEFLVGPGRGVGIDGKSSANSRIAESKFYGFVSYSKAPGAVKGAQMVLEKAEQAADEGDYQRADRAAGRTALGIGR